MGTLGCSEEFAHGRAPVAYRWVEEILISDAEAGNRFRPPVPTGSSSTPMAGPSVRPTARAPPTPSTRSRSPKTALPITVSNRSASTRPISLLRLDADGHRASTPSAAATSVGSGHGTLPMIKADVRTAMITKRVVPAASSPATCRHSSAPTQRDFADPHLAAPSPPDGGHRLIAGKPSTLPSQGHGELHTGHDALACHRGLCPARGLPYLGDAVAGEA
jgi:hypothetical protein